MQPIYSLGGLKDRLSCRAIQLVCAFHNNRRAVTAIEYALIAGVIVTAIIGSLLSTIGPNLTNTFNTVGSKL
jgi:Flp pilus assembly pilin Flp